MNIFIKTFGCQSNIADSEQMAGILKKHKIVNNEKDADIIILNSCSVKNSTQSKCLQFIKDNLHKKLFVGGCLPKTIDLRKKFPQIKAVFDTNSITKINEIIEKAKDTFSKTKEKRINLPRIRKNENIAIINISQGCLGFCDYCSAKLSRGELKSYMIKDIKHELEQAVKKNCNKIYLTSQDNSCYGFDIKISLPKLLKELITVKGNYKIRIGMMNPRHAKIILNDLVEIYKSDKIMKFLHIPVQSGSDKVLKDMNRNHTIKDFKLIVNKFRKNIPDITISTDIICGYPSETEEDFQKTLELIKEIKPEVLNISMFSSRPKTKASELKQLPSEIIKDRSRRLTKLYKEIKRRN